MSQLRDILLQLIRSDIKDITLTGTVVSIDNAQTCTVAPDDGTDNIPGVNLQAVVDDNDVTYITYPAENSAVIITRIGNEEAFYISMMSVIDSIFVSVGGSFKYLLNKDGMVFNDGKNGGMAITPELVKQLGIMQAQIQALEDLLTAWVPVPNDGGAALKTAWTTLKPNMQAPNFSKVENKKITH